MTITHQIQTLKFKLSPIKSYWPYALFLFLTVLIFVQCYSFEFLWWDDRENIFDNIYVQRNDWSYFWDNHYYGLFIPIPYTIWTFIWQFFPNDPQPFHLLNVFVHFLNSIIVYKILKYMHPENKSATIFATLLFLVHPLQVETVAWTSGLRDTLGYFFGFSALYLWIQTEKQLNFKSFLGFVLLGIGLLCKPTVSIIPILYIFITFDYNIIFNNTFFKKQASAQENDPEQLTKLLKKERKLKIKNEKNNSFSILNFTYLTFPIFGVIISLFAIYYSSSIQAGFIREDSKVDFYYRPIVALDTLGFYLQKFFVPYHLSAEYGRIPSSVIEENLYIPTLLTILGVIAVFILFVILYFGIKKWNKLPLSFHTKISFYSIFLLLLPTSGLFGFAYQNISTTADRYFYAPLLGVALTISSIQWTNKKWNYIFGFMIFIFSVISFMRVQDWRTNESFFSSMIESNPKSYSAHLNFANIERAHNNLPKALEHFQKAHEIRPDELGPLAGQMLIYGLLGQNSKIEEIYNEYFPKIVGMRTSGPHLSVFYAMLGFVRFQSQKFDEAYILYCNSIKADPTYHEGERHLEVLKQKLIEQKKPVPPCI